MANDRNFKIKNGLALDDNKKIELGDSADLQIYHDGTNSYISDTAVGDLKLTSNGTNITFEKADGTDIFNVATSGATTAYYNGNAKFATTSTGVDITGTLTSDGLTVDGSTTINSGTLTQTTSGDSRNYFRSSTGDRSYAYFQNSDTGTTDGDGFIIGINSSENALIYYTENQPIYIGNNGVTDRITLESDGDFLIRNTDRTAFVAKFNALTNNVELVGDIIFEGSTADANETTVTVTNPTADRTFTIPDQTGTAMLWQQAWPDDPGSDNIAIGDNTLSDLDSGGQRNIAIGSYSLSNVTSGDFNTAVGALTLNYLTTGGRNTAVGTEAGSSSSATTVTDNTYIGHQAGQYSTGSSNTSVGKGSGGNTSASNFMVNLGYQAGYESGSDSVNIGYQAGYNTGMNQSAIQTVAIGRSAGDGITSGDYNTIIGSNADVSSFSGASYKNVAIGAYTSSGYAFNVSIGTNTELGISTSAAQHNVNIGYVAGNQSNADYGVYIGRNAGYKNNADNCIFIGDYSGGYLSKSGLLNVGVGYRTLFDATSGNTNTALGAAAGYKCSSGYRNVYIGNNAGGTGSSTGHSTGYNSIIIGYNSLPSSTSAANEITLGDSTITSLRCNVTTISSLSDERDKTDIQDLPYGLDFINDMRPVQFTWNRRDGSMNNVPDFGFIAQDLHDVELEHSSTNRTRLVKWENPDKLEADYVRSYPILVKAVQELSAKCDALEARLAALEGV